MDTTRNDSPLIQTWIWWIWTTRLKQVSFFLDYLCICWTRGWTSTFKMNEENVVKKRSWDFLLIRYDWWSVLSDNFIESTFFYHCLNYQNQLIMFTLYYLPCGVFLPFRNFKLFEYLFLYNLWNYFKKLFTARRTRKLWKCNYSFSIL